jgi:hypothetical protein
MGTWLMRIGQVHPERFIIKGFFGETRKMQQVNGRVVQVLPAVCCQSGAAKQLKMRLQNRLEKALDFQVIDVKPHARDHLRSHTTEFYYA